MQNKQYAIVNIHGRQYKVAAGDTVKTQLISTEIGSELHFDEVLVVSDGQNVKLGAPFVSGAKVSAKVVSHGRDDKVLVFKYLRKNKSKRMYGHRQPFSVLSVTSIAV